MQEIPDGSIDMILCDLPYGTTYNKWDKVLPLDELWEQYKRVIKKNGCIALHSDMPFTVDLINACRSLYRYELIWHKSNATDFMNANRKPLKAHESIQIFYKSQPTYNPQKTEGKPYSKVRTTLSPNYHIKERIPTVSNGERYPRTVLNFSNAVKGGLHPTQKPIELEEWLIRTYTNEGDTVLDNCMGSGTTCVACVNTRRHYIGFEKEEGYFKTAQERIATAKDNLWDEVSK